MQPACNHYNITSLPYPLTPLLCKSISLIHSKSNSLFLSHKRYAVHHKPLSSQTTSAITSSTTCVQSLTPSKNNSLTSHHLITHMQQQTNTINLKKDIQKIISSLRKKPLTENFWQKELRTLRDKYDCYNRDVFHLITQLDDKLANCTSPSSL